MAKNDLRSTILTEHRKISASRHILAFINFIAVLVGTLVTLFFVGKRGAPDVIFVHLYILLGINIAQLALCLADYALKNYFGIYFKYLPIVSYAAGALWVIVTVSELIFGTIELGVLRNDLLGVAIIQFVVSLVAYLVWPMMDRMAIDSMIKPSAREDEAKRAKAAKSYVLRYALLCLFIVVAQVGSLLVYKVPPKLYDLFAESRALKYELSDTEDGYIVTKVYAGKATLVNIPATYNKKPVIQIAKGALVEDSLVDDHKVTEIVFGTPTLDENGNTVYQSNLKYIDEGAISNNNIEELVIPESVVKIGNGAIKSTSLKQMHYAAKADFSISYLECENVQKIIMQGENVGNIVSLDGMSETTNIQISKDIYNHYREANLQYVGSFTPILADDEYYIDFFTGCDYYVETIFGKLGEDVSIAYSDLVNADMTDRASIAVDTYAYIKNKHELGTMGAKDASAFRGWYYDANFTQECVFSENVPIVFNKTTALYAKWITEYTGTLDWGTYEPKTTDGIENWNGESEAIYWTDEDEVDFPVVTDRDGYKSVGVTWKVDNDLQSSTSSKGVSEDVTLHATWTLDAPVVDIEFKHNDGSTPNLRDEGDTATFTYDEILTLTLSAKSTHELNSKGNSYAYSWQKVGDNNFSERGSSIVLQNVAEAGQYQLVATLTSSWGETAQASTGVKVNINRKDIQMGTVRLDSQETIYNANPQKAVYSGQLVSENIKETWSYYNEKDDSLVTQNKQGVTNAGEYRVVVTFEKDNPEEAANYNTKSISAGYTVHPKQLQFVRWKGNGTGWDGTSIVYDGKVKTYMIELDGVLGTDTVNVIYENNSHTATDAGNYTSLVKNIDNANYSITNIDGQNKRCDWNILQKEVTVGDWRLNGVTGSTTVVYNGAKHSVSALLNGKVTGETVNFVYSSDLAFNNEGVNAGTYYSKIIGVDDNNYYFNAEAASAEYTWTITQRPLKIDYASDNYTYNSTAQVLTATISDFADGEAELFNDLSIFEYTYSVGSNIQWVGQSGNTVVISFHATNAGTYDVSIYGLNANKDDFIKNYTIQSNVSEGSFEIKSKEIRIKKANVEYTYTGLTQELPIVVTGIYSADINGFRSDMFVTDAEFGRVNGDTYELVYSGKNAGDYSVGVSAFEYGNANYVLTASFEDTVVINKQAISLTKWNITDKTPDMADATSALSANQGFVYNYYGYEVGVEEISGLVNGESVSLTLSNKLQKNASLDAYTTVASLNTVEYPNYKMTDTSIDWYINAYEVEFAWVVNGLKQTTFVYDGEEKTVEPQYTLLGDDEITVDYTYASDSVTQIDVGEFDYTISTLGNANYKIKTAEGENKHYEFSFSITKKEVTVDWLNSSTTYTYSGEYQGPQFALEGVAERDFDQVTLSSTAIYSPVVGGNGNTQITFEVVAANSYAYTDTKGFAVDAGAYNVRSFAIYKNGVVDGNYTMSADNKFDFSINPKALDLTGIWNYSNDSRGSGVYNDASIFIYNAKAYTVTTDFIESQIVERLGTKDVLELVYDSNVKMNANDYVTSVTGLSGVYAKNYELTEAGKTLDWTISQKRLALSWNVTEKIYNTETRTQRADVTYTATTDDDGYAYSSDYVSLTYSSDSGLNAGTYTSVVSGLDNSNYYLDEATLSQVWEIKPYQIELDWSQEYFTYNAQPQSPTASCYIAAHGKTVNAAGYENTNNINVGTYTVTAVGTDDSNYILKEGIAHTKEYYIQAKEFTLSWAVNNAVAQSVYTYDGNEYEVIPTAVGVCLGDSVNLTYEDNLFENVGSYTMTVTAWDNTNYYLADYNNSWNITVNQKVLTLAWYWDNSTTERSFTYDGEYHTLHAEPVGVVDGDTVDIIYAQSDVSVINVGTYTVQIEGFNNANYTFDVSNYNDYTKNISITAQRVKITWTGTSRLTYDGNEHVTALEVRGADNNEIIYSNADFATHENAGSYTLQLTQTILNNYDSNNSNYTLNSPVEGVTTYAVVIDAKVVTIAWTGLENVYDGNSHYAVATVTNLCEGDSVSLSYRANRLSSYGSIGSSANYATSAGEYNVYVYSLGNSNYTLVDAQNVSTTLSIAKQEVKIAWSETGSFEYNGSYHSFGATLTGADDGKNIANFGYTGASGSQKNVGTYNLTVGTINDTNYTLENAQGDLSKTYYVTPKTLEVSWTSTLQYNYDGNSKTIKWQATNSLSQDGTVYLLCNYEVVGQKGSLVYGGGNQISATDVGVYRVTLTGVSNNQNGNYVLPEDGEQLTRTFEITPQKVSLSWNGTIGEKTYSASTSYSMYATATGTVQGRSVSIATVLDVATQNQKYKNVGTYSVTVTGLEESYANNFTLEGVANLTGSINIVPQMVTLSWGSLTTVYNGLAQLPTLTVRGSNDGQTVAHQLLTEESIVNVGEYQVGVELTDSNYTLDGVANTTVNYRVNAQAVSVVWSNTELTYNGEVQVPTATVVGASDGKPVPFQMTEGNTNAGSYTATVTLLKNNYTLNGNENASVEYEIAPQAVIVTWSNTTFTYNGEVQAPTATVVGASDGKSVGFTLSEGKTAVGVYSITATLTDANYTLNDNPNATVDFEIVAQEVTVTVTNATLTYNGADQAATVTVVGAIDGKPVDFQALVGATNVGDYAETLVLLNDNYTLRRGDETVGYEIVAKELTINWTLPNGETADGTAKTVSAVANGTVNGESFELVVTIKNSKGQTVTTVTEAGTYTVTVTAVQGASQNYSIANATKSATFTIEEAEEPEV